MVEKIVVAPNEVRGYGNIVDNDKDKSDLCFYNSFVNADTDLIDGIRIGIMRMIYQDPNLFFSFHQLEKYLYVNSDDMTLSFDSTNKCLVFDDTTESFSLGFDSTNKVLYIGETGEHNYSIAFSQSSYTASGGSATLEITLLDNNVPVQSASVTVTGSDSSSYTGITNSSGVAEVTVTGVSGTVTFTCTYSNVSAQCTVTAQTYLFYDSGVSGTKNNNFLCTKTTGNYTLTTESTGTVFLCSGGDGFYIPNIDLHSYSSLEITWTFTYGTRYACHISLLNSNKSYSNNMRWHNAGTSTPTTSWYAPSGQTSISHTVTSGDEMKLTLSNGTWSLYCEDELIGTATPNYDVYYIGLTSADGNRPFGYKDLVIKR